MSKLEYFMYLNGIAEAFHEGKVFFRRSYLSIVFSIFISEVLNKFSFVSFLWQIQLIRFNAGNHYFSYK